MANRVARILDITDEVAPVDDNVENIPIDNGLVNYLLSQGDNVVVATIEDMLREIFNAEHARRAVHSIVLYLMQGDNGHVWNTVHSTAVCSFQVFTAHVLLLSINNYC